MQTKKMNLSFSLYDNKLIKHKNDLLKLLHKYITGSKGTELLN